MFSTTYSDFPPHSNAQKLIFTTRIDVLDQIRRHSALLECLKAYIYKVYHVLMFLIAKKLVYIYIYTRRTEVLD